MSAEWMAEKRDTGAQCVMVADVAHADFLGGKTGKPEDRRDTMREDAMGCRYEYGQTARPSLSPKRERSLTCMCRTWIPPKEATAVDGEGKGSRPTHPDWQHERSFPRRREQETVLTRWLPRAFRPTGLLMVAKFPKSSASGPVPLFASHCQCFLPPPQSSAFATRFREI